MICRHLRRARQINPRGIASICMDRRRSWGEIAERVPRIAGGLAAAGVRPGARVAILSENSDAAFEAYYALWWIGAVVVPINMRLSPMEIGFRIADSGAELVLVDKAHAQTAIAGSVTVLPLGEGESDAAGTNAMAVAADAAPDAGRSGADLAMIVYTGGSTGRAKGVMLTHANLSANALCAMQAIGYDRSTVYLHAGPMSHLADGMSTLAVTLAAGTHVFLPRFTVEGCVAAIESHRVTHTCIVPTAVEMLVRAAEAGSTDLSSLVQIQFGAAPMPDATLRRAVALWPDLLFLHGYGMTEAAPLITLHPKETRSPAVAGALLQSCGQAVPTIELRIEDDAGNELPASSVGEIVVRGPTVTPGYWNLAEATEEALRDGWLHTGDLGFIDDDGYVFIKDRKKDMIITGGENVYSIEVEDAIAALPGVRAAAVVGLANPLWGEAVHAVVQVDPDSRLDAEAVISGCRARLAAYKCPKTVTITLEPLPLTSAGKIDKVALRTAAAGNAA